MRVKSATLYAVKWEIIIDTLIAKKHNTTKIQQKILHSCECGKSYNHRASLFNHKKKCNYVFVEENENKKITTISENIDYKDLLINNYYT